MKLIATIVLAIFSTFAAPAQTASRFIINGDVSAVKAPVIMVKLFYYIDGEAREDSSLVIAGKYSFKGQLKEPRMGYFSVKYADEELNKNRVSKRDQFSAYLENAMISIRSIDSFANRQVSGSVSHTVYERLTKKDKEYNEKIALLYKEMSTVKEDKEAVDKLEKQVKELDNIRKEKVYVQFIKENPSSPMAIFALQNYAGYKMDPNEVDPLFDGLSQTVKDSWSGKDFYKKLEGARRLRIGAMATDFTQNDTSGVAVRLSDFKGQYVLVDFWASWCGPCRRENPNVVQAYKKYQDKNFTVLGVALEREGDNERWMKAIYKDQLTWTQVSDFKYFNNQAAVLYGINAIPRNFLMDPAGKIIATDLRGEELLNTLEEFIK